MPRKTRWNGGVGGSVWDPLGPLVVHPDSRYGEFILQRSSAWETAKSGWFTDEDRSPLTLEIRIICTDASRHAEREIGTVHAEESSWIYLKGRGVKVQQASDEHPDSRFDSFEFACGGCPRTPRIKAGRLFDVAVALAFGGIKVIDLSHLR